MSDEGIAKWCFNTALECSGFNNEGSRPEKRTQQEKSIALMVVACLRPSSWAPVLEGTDWLEGRKEWTRL